jgi:hypothetical protein
LYLLEEEVIVNQLLLGGLIHALEWVEGTLEIALKSVASLDDLGHDFESLFLGDSWTEWVPSEISSNSNSSGDNHGGIILWELSVLNALGTHSRGVGVLWLMTVVVLDNLIEELVELGVSIVRACVDTDSGIEVLNTGEDAGLECNSLSAGLVLVLFPNLLGQALGKLRLGTSWEESIKIFELIS